MNNMLANSQNTKMSELRDSGHKIENFTFLLSCSLSTGKIVNVLNTNVRYLAVMAHIQTLLHS